MKKVACAVVLSFMIFCLRAEDEAPKKFADTPRTYTIREIKSAAMKLFDGNEVAVDQFVYKLLMVAADENMNVKIAPAKLAGICESVVKKDLFAPSSECKKFLLDATGI
jgi:hypothetical protein